MAILLVLLGVSVCARDGSNSKYLEKSTGLTLSNYEIVEYRADKGRVFGDHCFAWLLRHKAAIAEMPAEAQKSDQSDYLFVTNILERLLVEKMDVEKESVVYRMGSERSDVYLIRGVDPKYLYVYIFYN
jgi:hypothetical protein